MKITWLNAKEREGVASLYATNITLNTVASVPFEYAYRVQVGIDEKGNVVIQPLSKDRVLRGDLDEYAIQKIAIKKSYSRISSTDIMKKIAGALGIALDETPRRYKTKWDDKENILTICTGKE
ncbi:MAG TPA: hypothetical protein PLR04_01485 [Bacilli bacterium]|nr:hypothetical protein [Bacilli bacterium]